LMGRELQKHFGMEAQVIITMPLLVGLDGVQKMSKSLGNYIGIDEPAEDMFGKIMSISDALMWRYFELVSLKSLDEIAVLKRAVQEGKNPRDIKIELALELITRFHSKARADQAHQDFIQRFSKNELPEYMPEFSLNFGAGLGIAQVLKAAGLVASTSEGLRMIDQGGVKLNGEKISNRALILQPKSDEALVLQVGKRKFARIRAH